MRWHSQPIMASNHGVALHKGCRDDQQVVGQRGRHTFIACVLNEWVCWRGLWNGRKRRSGGSQGRRGRCKDATVMQWAILLTHAASFKSCSLKSIYAVAPHVLRPGANAQACARGIQAGDSQHSRSYAASMRSTDSGTSLFPLSFLSHLLILG